MEKEIKFYNNGKMPNIDIWVKESIGASERTKSIVYSVDLIFDYLLKTCDYFKGYQKEFDYGYGFPGVSGIEYSKLSFLEVLRQLELQLSPIEPNDSIIVDNFEYGGLNIEYKNYFDIIPRSDDLSNLGYNFKNDILFAIQPNSREIYSKLLEYLDENSRNQVEKFIEQNNSKYAICQLNDILDDNCKKY